MPPSIPFIDRDTGTLDTTEIILEAIPLAKLVGGIVAVALVPFAMAFLLRGSVLLGALFSALGQFVLAVGAGIVLIYAIVRALQLADGEYAADR
ncbi:hypothetical protein [Halopiger xanaduensis]|uniref:Uncharacterized protein n=1 Tax=Halopiger xanaduensis (strain DSM 18323 / JCM 14033 / SH-6) TaxID=797210 RepID=F8D6D7_HALXS|nr:hypothetical protein [Halopiger xanaduensis]AEH35392.1 hypothetical protein Halxa_0753 [Halopiger xanaduensis SH-6]